MASAFTPISDLHQDLIHAAHRRQWLRHHLDHLETELQKTFLPAHHWRPAITKHLRTLETRFYQAQREFYRLRKLFLAENAPPKSLGKQKPPGPQSETPADPEVDPEDLPITLRQTAKIEILNGETVTTIIGPDAAWFLAHRPYGKGVKFGRTLCFVTAEFPPEYAYASSHNGEPVEFAPFIFVTYSQDEFLRLCQLEIDTQAPHLLDGERLGFQRFE